MATNKGRVIGGYLDANGNIVEEYANPAQEMHDFIFSNETEFNPSWATAPTTTYATPVVDNYFPNAQAYGLQAQGYAGQGNNAMANAFGGLANDLGAYSNYANNTINTYNALWNGMNTNEEALRNVAGNTYNTLIGDIQNQRDYINRMFGPNGELTKEVNTYYDDLGNYLSTEAGRQAANIAAQGIHSGASLGAIRAQQNEAYNEAFGRYVQAKEQQINAKQQIASNLINYMSTLRQEYGNTTNQYIIDLYKRANDLYNQTAVSLANDLNQYNTLRLSGSGSGGGSGGGGSSIADLLSNAGFTQNSDGTYSDAKGNKYKIGADGKFSLVTSNGVIKEQDPKKSLGQVIKERTGINPEQGVSLLDAAAGALSLINPFNGAKLSSTILDPAGAVKDILKDKNLASGIINSIIR